jgi:hypothetical protein
MENENKTKGSWHPEACAMRLTGAPYSQIAKKFGVSITAAYFAVHPEKRHGLKKKVKADLSEALPGDTAAA